MLPPYPLYCRHRDSLPLLVGTGRGALHFMDEVATQHVEVVRAASSYRHTMEQLHSKRQPPNVR
jgi:hypothetical protein